MIHLERDPADGETLDLMNAVERLSALGLPVSVDPDIAEEMGAFAEDALSVDDAIESLFDPEEIEPDADDLSDLDGEEADHV